MVAIVGGTRPDVPRILSPIGRTLPQAVFSIVGGRDYGSTNQHTCAIVKPACAKSGQVWCWGENGVGQIGDGTKTERDRPVKVVAP